MTLLEFTSAMPTRRTVDQPRIAGPYRQLLAALGEDPDRDGLRGTPGRVASWCNGTGRSDLRSPTCARCGWLHRLFRCEPFAKTALPSRAAFQGPAG